MVAALSLLDGRSAVWAGLGVGDQPEEIGGLIVAAFLDANKKIITFSYECFYTRQNIFFRDQGSV